MKTLATIVTERGQVSIPAEIRRQMRLISGQRILWEAISPSECRIVVTTARRQPGAMAMLGFSSTFRKPRRTQAWLDEFREGEKG